MQIVLNQTQHTIGDFEQIFHDLRFCLTSPASNGAELVIFPESFLTGYPLQDLVLQKQFIDSYLQELELFKKWVIACDTLESSREVLVGGLEYEFDENGLPLFIKNVIFQVCPKEGLKNVYTKCLLPNYDIFDEQKYFCAGDSAHILKFNDKNIGLLICEDMWFSSTHKIDPIELLRDKALEEVGKIKLDLIVNLSASPYFLGKDEKRIKRAQEIACLFESPFAYVNRVGSEDEIIFDGNSFYTDGTKVSKAKAFEEDILIAPLTQFNGVARKKDDHANIENSWESLFQVGFTQKSPTELPTLCEWTDSTCKEVIEALCFGFQEYARKCYFSKFTVALSGGVDSGLVLSLLKLALKPGQTLEAIYMPSKYSSSLSTELAEKLCQNLEIPLTHFPIKFLHSTVAQAYLSNFRTPLEGLADENIQSRLRGNLLYARSNQLGSMVINTSNKSEIAVGYSTMYGDSVGAISLLGDLYKSEVFRLTRYLLDHYDFLPEEYLTRPPSAELRENQEDSQSLPPYERLDVILEGLLSYQYSKEDLVSLGFDREEVSQVYGQYTKSEYKRNQFSPILKIKAKSFGFGYRVPITKKV
jgi:NAD+ synthase (glutamine-hydrolysing)